MKKHVLNIKTTDLNQGIFHLKQILTDRENFLKKVNLTPALDDRCKAVKAVIDILEGLRGSQMDS